MEYDKTFRLGMLCCVILILGLFYFLFKVEACKTGPASCRDEFMAFEVHNNPTCTVGAVAEVVTSPPAPKSGIICHCTKPVGSAEVKPEAK